MVDHNRRHDDGKWPWEKVASALSLFLLVCGVVTAVVGATNYFATKDEVERTYRSSRLDLEKSQEAQDAFFKEYIYNAARTAADLAVEKYIEREKKVFGRLK